MLEKSDSTERNKRKTQKLPHYSIPPLPFFSFSTKVQLINNVVLVLGVQQKHNTANQLYSNKNFFQEIGNVMKRKSEYQYMQQLG